MGIWAIVRILLASLDAVFTRNLTPLLALRAA
jgi:hypothetical protein